MAKIPEILQQEDFRFVKIQANSKRPFETAWQKNNNYKYNDSSIQEHLEQDGNYGVIGGYGDLVIIDADQNKVEIAIEANLPSTLKIRSGGGGSHFYYKCSDLENPIRLSDNEAGDLGDVQGEGKQAVGPTSIHPSGNKYKIEEHNEIAEVKAEKIRFALRSFIDSDKIDPAKEQEKLNKEYDQEIDLNITEVCSLSSLERRSNEFQGGHPVHGSSTGNNFCVNTRKNTWHCFRHDTGGGPMSWIAVKEGIITCGEATPGALSGEKFKQVLEIARDKYGLPDPKEKFDKKMQNPDKMDWKHVIQLFEDGNTSKLESIKKTADFLMTRHNFKTTEDNEELFIFDKEELIYRKNGKQVVNSILESNIKNYIRARDKEEVIDSIKSRTYTPRPKGGQNKKYLVVENGWLDLENRELEDGNPDVFITTKIPLEYDPEADCPKIKNFISQIVADENEKLLQELTGYCLYRDYPIAKAFMLIGDGKNGKSTFLNLLQKFLGQENIATPSLHQLVNNRFAKSELYGKLANIHGDLDNSTLKQTGPFKMLTGGDLIRGEKKYQDSFVFKNYAKLIYSANELPRSKDTTDAFFRRWLIIKFPYKFTENPNDSHKQKDESLPESLFSQEELSGMLNWALEGLDRLLENGHFTKTGEMEEIKETWLTRTNPLKVFKDKYIKVEEDEFITKDDFHKAYVNFCDDHNAPSLDKNVVGRKLPTMIPETDSFKPKINGKQQTAWKNLSFKDDVTQEGYIKDIKDNNVPSQAREEESSKEDIEKGVQKNLSIPDNSSKNILNNVRRQLQTLEEISSDNGVDEQELINNTPFEEEKVVRALKQLKNEGEAYEPVSGKISIL